MGPPDDPCQSLKTILEKELKESGAVLTEYRNTNTNTVYLKLHAEFTRLQAALASCPSPYYLSVYSQNKLYPRLLEDAYKETKAVVKIFPTYQIHTVISSSEITTLDDLSQNSDRITTNCVASQRTFKQDEKLVLDNLKHVLLSHCIYIRVYYEYDPHTRAFSGWFFEVLRPVYMERFRNDFMATVKIVRQKIEEHQEQLHPQPHETDSLLHTVDIVLKETLDALESCSANARNVNNLNDFFKRIDAIGYGQYRKLHWVCKYCELDPIMSRCQILVICQWLRNSTLH